MANNPYVNKVEYGGNTIIDLTNDTVEASNLLSGETAHDRSGAPVTGTATQGHKILNYLRTVFTQRSKLRFKDAHISDDGTNDTTDVSIVEAISKTDWDNLDPTDPSNNGLYEITDPNNTPILTASEVGYGTETVKDALDKLIIASPSPLRNITEGTTVVTKTGSGNMGFSLDADVTGWYSIQLGVGSALRFENNLMGFDNSSVLGFKTLIYLPSGSYSVRYYGTSGSSECTIKHATVS